MVICLAEAHIAVLPERRRPRFQMSNAFVNTAEAVNNFSGERFKISLRIEVLVPVRIEPIFAVILFQVLQKLQR